MSQKAEQPYTGPLGRLRRALDRSSQPGEIGLVLARAGVGKTSLLVQMGLGELLAGRQILHVAAGQTVEQIEARYDVLFRDLAAAIGLPDPRADRVELARHRAIQAHGHVLLTAGRVYDAASTFRKHLGLQPSVVLVDGYDWERDGACDRVAMADYRELGQELGACIWMTASTHRERSGAHVTELPPPLSGVAELIDAALFLEPVDERIHGRLIKAYGAEVPAGPVLDLAPATLRPRIRVDRVEPVSHALPALYTLLSGAARGAEAEFGACAERWGLAERNFSFAGREVQRRRGLVMLSAEELAQGAVSWKYITSQLHRDFRQSESFKRVLYSIWHQVNPAGEVFSVGEITERGTVKGGTGWAVELARHWHKPVHVFDQNREAWFRWDGEGWHPADPPVIRCRRFCGSGTRHLTDAGRTAIQELFERTFG